MSAATGSDSENQALIDTPGPSTTTTFMSTGLLGTSDLRLPNELALLIIEHLAGSNRALCNLARTCRGLQYPAEAEIYKTIELLSVTDLEDVIQAFTYRHQRARTVQTLKILYQYRPEDLQNSEQTRAIFNECIAHMVNLREWHIVKAHSIIASGMPWVAKNGRSRI